MRQGLYLLTIRADILMWPEGPNLVCFDSVIDESEKRELKELTGLGKNSFTCFVDDKN